MIPWTLSYTRLGLEGYKLINLKELLSLDGLLSLCIKQINGGKPNGVSLVCEKWPFPNPPRLVNLQYAK